MGGANDGLGPQGHLRYRESRLGETGGGSEADQTPLHEVDAYIKEFWRLYWGPLGMVEGPEVETAMVKFGNALRAWERWELKKPRESWPTIREDLARTREELVKALGYDLDKPIRLEKGQLRNQQPQLQKYLSPKN